MWVVRERWRKKPRYRQESTRDFFEVHPVSFRLTLICRIAFLARSFQPRVVLTLLHTFWFLTAFILQAETPRTHCYSAS